MNASSALFSDQVYYNVKTCQQLFVRCTGLPCCRNPITVFPLTFFVPQTSYLLVTYTARLFMNTPVLEPSLLLRTDYRRMYAKV